ncbi:MAG TPA: hypothetical protein VH881_15450 [Burkholderiales bacterium]|jgi:hypothetical protein
MEAVETELRTREDVRRYLDAISERISAGSRATQLWLTAKQGMWLLLLVAAFLQYYFLDILVQIDSLPGITFPPR